MSYSFQVFDYICPASHTNEFSIAYDLNVPIHFPQMLPCSSCNYKLVPALLVPKRECNFSESDFYKFQDAKYVESSAYHEAGHVVVGVVEGIPLRKDGIRIDQKGAGYSHYRTMRLSGATSVGPDRKREKAVRSAQAGYIAQEKFYRRFFNQLPPSGSCEDINYINGLLDEMYEGRQEFFDAKDELYKETQQLVGQHWQAIEALAQTLLKKTWKSQAPPSGERRWSTQLAERRVHGYEVVALLQQFEISTSVEVSGTLESFVRGIGFALGYLSGVKALKE